ncbi:MAG: PAS domain S-box protein [Desulfobacterales bacterium]
MKDMQSTGPGKKRGLWMIGVSALIGAALFTWFLLARADRQMRTDLLQQAQLVAQALNIDRIRALTATEADLTNPHYRNLKERLIAVRAVNPNCRFVYLMGRRIDGTVFFFVDSEPTDSEDYSPPGQVYEDATESDIRAFDTRTPAVEGPYPDRWGVWVSALVPVINPKTNDLLAMLGMDIDARDWKWNVAEKAALPAGLIFVLLIVVFASRIAARRITPSPRPVLNRLLLPLTGMVVLLTVGSGALLWNQYQDQIARDVTTLIDVANRDLQTAVDQHASAMLQTLKTVAANSGKALREGDAERLLADWRPVFDRMHREINLTHFNFLDANRVCLLRVHNPEKRGGLINRFTALEAERTGEAVSGIELGNQGVLTLRTVQPVFDDNRLAGYVELGKEISNVLESMSLRPGVQMALLVHKGLLNRQTFEEGMHRLGKTFDWEFLPHSVVIHASRGSLPDAFAPVADHDPAVEHAHNRIDREVRFDGKNWRVSAAPLKDASGKAVGCLLVMCDITSDQAAFMRLTILGGTAAAVLLALLLGLIYVLLRRTDAGIRAQQAKLQESEERLSATLRSIGDGVITCDMQGGTVSLNAVAEVLTGWSSDEARGRPVSEIFRIVHAETRQETENPVVRTLREGLVVELANHTMLIARDGTELHIADSCAAIHNTTGSVIGAVLVFRDVSEAYRRREQERFELRFQQTVTELSAQFVNISESEFDEGVNQILARLGMLFDVDRSYLFSCSEDLSAISNTHEWCTPGIAPQKDRIQNFPTDAMPWWKSRMRELIPLHIPDVEALPPEAEAEKKEFRLQDIQSLICLPMRSDRGQLMGFLGFDAVRAPHAWPEHQIQRLQVVAGIIGSAINRNAAHRKLGQSEIKYRLLIENSRDIIFTLTPEAVFSFVSPSSIVLLGYPPGQMVGRHFEKFVHPDDVPRCSAFLQRVVKKGHRQDSAEYRIQHIDGSWRWQSANVLPLRNESGRLLGFQGASRDITAQKQSEEAARDSQRRLEEIIEFLPDATLVIDREGRVIAWNRSIESLTGIRKEDILGRGDHEYALPFYGERRPILIDLALHPRPEMELAYIGVHRKEGILFGESYTPNLPGGNLYLTGTASVLRDANGEIVAAIECIRDNTERKTMEANLQETNRHLEEATIRAGNMAAQAEMASIAKGEFLANMSHEIRTPMNGVIGMTGLLLDTRLTDEQRRYAEIVRISAESLLGLINDILDFSKIEAKKLDLENLDFDLLSLMEDFTAVLALRAHEKGLDLFCATDPAVPALLRGDPGRLRQILTNLTGNAVKFTPAGEVVVRVSVAEEGEKDVLLRFAVRDTGIGIPKDKTEMLFDKFTQVDASTTRQYGGTGLGLAISKQLAELMGGEIGVASEAGRGSEFWFTARFGKQAEGTRRQSIPSADLNDVRVLIVDDNATSREILTAHLVSWGMRPSEAKDGPEALHALHEALDGNDPFRIALIDMQMPGMDGEALGRTIREDKRLAGARMVMLTSLGMRGDARRFEEIGFAAYATKPIRHDELRTVLSLALRGGDKPVETGQPIATRHTAREMLNWFKDRKARILLAEDNITNQQVALGILKKLGLRADAVANGAEAVKALEAIPYDLVLMDVQMPEMDGLEATLAIRNREPESGIHPVSRIPIIAMTAHAMQGDRERCLEAGMNDYISKPVTPLALAEVLEKWLSKDLDETGTTNKDENREKADVFESGSSPIFDRAGMMARVMDDEDLARTVIESFLQDIPLQIKVLRGYLEAGDARKAERQAHTIKGASANIGGEALRATAFEMEKSAGAGNLSAALAAMDDLETQFERLKEAMEKQD